MTFAVRSTPSADAMVRALDAWWRANRTKAPDRFKAEYGRALSVLAETPHVGAPYRRRGIPGLRRYRLPRTPYHVYYVPRAELGEGVVVAVWSGARRRGAETAAP